ncbi:hypothetical protein LI328DRAFT_134108 [Trichoderma asperelloides]|nr:hypothetical protein LI328DRAFT_134108 [Trichoderma asperelloides]
MVSLSSVTKSSLIRRPGLLVQPHCRSVKRASGRRSTCTEYKHAHHEGTRGGYAMPLRLGLYHALARVRFKPHCISVPITVKLLPIRSQNSVLRDLFVITPRRYQHVVFRGPLWDVV